MKMRKVTGSAEEMKFIKNAASNPTTPMGGTSRPKFTGSNDTRAAGAPTGNRVLKSANGYVDQAPISIGDTSHSRMWTKKGNR